jgi:hypothetical protein
MTLPSFPSTVFLNFFQRSVKGQKSSKKSRRFLPRAHCGAREKDRQVGGRRRYTPGVPVVQEVFPGKFGKLVFSTAPARLPDERLGTSISRKVLPAVRTSYWYVTGVLQVGG